MNNKTEKYGGKGSNLFLLKEAGFPVPEFVVLPVKGCTSHLYEFLDQHPHGTFAVRSSATAEDSDSQSFAGQFKTFLNVPAAKIEERIDAVKVSLRQEHISRYSEGPLQMAVVVQRMVKADVSGVIFTADPVSGHRNKTIISATYGLGEGLVSGEFDADTFTFRDGSWNNHIVQKEYKKEMSADGLHNLKVDENLQEIPCLNEGLLEKLRGISEKIESYFGQPQDIEFAVEGETIWILQSRPITTLKQGNHIIWDNSNIVESYPGITQPLTFSFILRIYKAVYEQLSGILGVPAKTIKEKEEVYANMLGLLKGRVYYNLINWYRVLAMVPCFSLNSGFMEKMMGTTSSYELPKDDHSRLWATRWHFLLSVFKILRAYRKLRRETREFQDYFNEVMQEYNQMDFESMEAWEVKEKLKRFENILLVKWRPPLVNDFFAMIFFGLFEKYTRKWYKGEDESVHNALLVGSQDIVSARPLAILAETDQLIRRNPGALEFFNRNSPEEVWLSLKKFPEIREKVDMYLTTFGDRTVGELKFETETYRQYPQRLIKVIQANLKQRTPLKKEQEEARVSVRKEAEKKVMAGIGNPFRKMIFRYLLKRTRYLVSNRENLRFERTRAFGMLRRMFLVLGGKLAKADALSAPRDIFYLRESEIFEWLEGTSVTINLKELVELRKQEYLQFGKEESPGERVETYGIVYQELDNETVVEDEESDLKGTACCAGVVEANIRVIHDPHEVKEGLNGEILVTSSTDPGWITLFYGAAGVLVERGSLLSHSAIVSREMGLPCIVSVKGLLKRLKTGDRVRMNGSTGTIEILDKNERENAA